MERNCIRCKRKFLARIALIILVTALIMTALSGCGAIDTSNPDFAKGNIWIDSDLIGSVTKDSDFRVQDDFAAAANKEWILTEGAEKKDGNLVYIANIVNNKKVSLLDDDSLTGKEAEELKKFASLAADWKYRDEDGVEPIRQYLEYIEAITSMDDFYGWIVDPGRNPLGLAPVEVGVQPTRLRAYPDEVTVMYGAPSLSLGDQSSYYNILGNALEKKEITDQKVTYVLGRLGYSEKDIKTILKQNYAVEKKLGRITSPSSTDEDADIKNTDSYEDIITAAGDYPLDEYMKAWGYDNVRHMIGDISYVKKVSKVCKEANLSGLKSMFLVNYVLQLGDFLDRETYDTFSDIDESRSKKDAPDYSTDEEKEKARICDYISESGLVAAMDKVYTDRYVDSESAKELTELTEDIIDVYRTEIFPNESWLSEEGKAACIEKLDAITLNVIYPDFSCVDYSDLNIVPKEENGTFLEAYLESMRYLTGKKAAYAGREFDRTEWFPYESMLSTTITNSVYVRFDNSINIYAGILEDPAYHKGMSREELLSGIGAIIGHEISHGFDNGGVQYDKDGLKNQWLPVADQQEFSDRASKVSTYYTSMQPYKSSGVYVGQNVMGEAVADMGGLKAMLKLAAREDTFDYDRFFRHYALLWAAQTSPEMEQWRFKNDEHPLNFYRINVGLQQYDEFYDTYDVQPDDKMYLEEKKRIAVW